MSEPAPDGTVAETPTVPRCPITGVPALRRIESMPVGLMEALWRISFRVSIKRFCPGISHFELWESPCGLAFFEPMPEGDPAFYEAVYGRLGEQGGWTSTLVQGHDYERVAALVQDGDRVLDVGCGQANFARHVPRARYVGLEPSAGAAYKGGADVRDESLEAHARANPESYDLVCSFHVVEHVASPKQFVARMAACLRPGGRLAIAAPGWPGAVTDIPNFILNAPPHHLTWWTPAALRAVAESCGLIVESADWLPPGGRFGLIFWMAKAVPRLRDQRFFSARWRSFFALNWSWLVGRVCHSFRDLPRDPRAFEVMLVARKPIAGA
jgi:SAM-dependent methyltransferase